MLNHISKQSNKHSKQFLPCRSDEFLCHHIDFLDGMNLDHSQNYIQVIDAAGGLKELLGENVSFSNDVEISEVASDMVLEDTSQNAP